MAQVQGHPLAWKMHVAGGGGAPNPEEIVAAAAITFGFFVDGSSYSQDVYATNAAALTWKERWVPPKPTILGPWFSTSNTPGGAPDIIDTVTITFDTSMLSAPPGSTHFVFLVAEDSIGGGKSVVGVFFFWP